MKTYLQPSDLCFGMKMDSVDHQERIYVTSWDSTLLIWSDLMHYLAFNCPWGPLGSPSWRRVVNNRHAMSSPQTNFPTKLHSNSLWERLLLQLVNFDHLYNRHMNLSLSWKICFLTYMYHKSIHVPFVILSPPTTLSLNLHNLDLWRV